jgi:2-phospho-L-lactate guanylyltransferase
MRLFAVIPVKPFAEGKSRLKDILSDTARRDLNFHMLEHVLTVAASMIGAANTIVVSADQTALALARDHGATTVREATCAGLNAALKVGAEHAVARGADAILILPTDLPTLSLGDLEALLDCAKIPPCVIIAPDRSNRGTNALLISPPDAIGFSFGPDSFTAHQVAAHAIPVNPVSVHRDGLAFDIDTPEDYQQLERQGWDAIRSVAGN